MEEYLRVGVITSTHGLRGEVKVFPATDDVRRFKKCREVLLEDTDGWKPMEIEGVKFFKQMVILKLKGCESIEQAESYKGKELFVTRKNAVPLKEGEYFIADLIGLQVYDEEEILIGTLKDVIRTGANDVYSVLTEEKKEILFPAIRECILDVDVERKVMHVHVMPGLMD